MLSALVPGLGQAYNGRRRLALWLFVPFAVVAALTTLIVWAVPGPRLLASVIVPGTLGALLALNLVVLGWRGAALFQAFTEPRYRAAAGAGRRSARIGRRRSSSW